MQNKVWVAGADIKVLLWQGYTRQKHRSGKATQEHKEQQLPCWEKKNQTGRVFPFQSQHVCLFSAPGSVRLLKNWKLPCTGKDTLWTKGKLEIFHIIFFPGHWAEVLTSKNGLLTHILSQGVLLFFSVMCGSLEKKCRGLFSDRGHWEQPLTSFSRALGHKEILNYLPWPQLTKLFFSALSICFHLHLYCLQSSACFKIAQINVSFLSFPSSFHLLKPPISKPF